MLLENRQYGGHGELNVCVFVYLVTRSVARTTQRAVLGVMHYEQESTWKVMHYEQESTWKAAAVWRD